MTRSLEARTALVTGGSSGIGAAIVEVLAREGASVAFTHWRDEDRAAAEAIVARLSAGGGRVLTLQADVTFFARAHEVVAETVQAFGALDILVANAGTNQDGVIWKMTEGAWDEAPRQKDAQISRSRPGGPHGSRAGSGQWKGRSDSTGPAR